MNDKIIRPVDVFVFHTSMNFEYAIHNLQKDYKEDMEFYYKRSGGKTNGIYFELLTKGWVRELVKSLDDTEEKFKWVVEQDINEMCRDHDKTLDELLSVNDILFGYLFDNKDFYKMDYGQRKSSGILPSLIYHPDEEISIKAVKEGVARYCREFINIPSCNVYVLRRARNIFSRFKGLKESIEDSYISNGEKVPENEFDYDPRRDRRSYVRKDFRKYKKDIENTKGKKFDMRMTRYFLRQMFGDEVHIIWDDVDYGFIKEHNYFAKLKNGEEVMLGKEP